MQKNAAIAGEKSAREYVPSDIPADKVSPAEARHGVALSADACAKPNPAQYGPAPALRSRRSASEGDTRPFEEIVAAALDRRTFVQASVAGLWGALAVAGQVARAEAAGASTRLFEFSSVPPGTIDRVVVPDGYVVDVLYRWGDPINGSEPQFRPDASNSAADQREQAGMGHDGMEFFALPGADPNERGLLVVNHEYADQTLLFADGIEPLPPARMPLEKVRKSQYAHGVSIVEIARIANGAWRVVESPQARRITACTPMRISGPAVSQLGETTTGTVNNCAAGRTPWGTYLTCEENFHSVFGATDPAFAPTPHQERYGLSATGFAYSIDGQLVPAYRWCDCDPRFDLSNPDNDADRFGYVVEIDPHDPHSTPVKRTALGRFKHENAALTTSRDGRVVVYMGDDERNEYIYKFVSAEPVSSEGRSRLECGDVLDKGTLYAARFSEDGVGQWLALEPGQNGIPPDAANLPSHGFAAADIAIATRQVADLAGATPMDRPEWIAVHPETNEVFVALTNNTSRGEARPVDAANPRAKNHFGHILRWRETNDDPGSTTFRWNVFVLAGNPDHPSPDHRGNATGDAFGCPDGLRFDSSGILWIQTDMSSKVMGDENFKELGQNMMLAADPQTGDVRRFLTGPRGCEITGNAMTPDRCTLFVNIQHPGEPADDQSDPTDPQKYSQWPDGPSGGRPRSATIVIRRLDGRPVGC